jgi:23S rRNA (uracil1939-C5)-methyltransferase
LLSPFTVTIEKIVPGGRGLAFHEGKAVLVPLVVPGDRIRVRRLKDRKSYIEVLDREVVDPSSDRTEPACPYFGTCGGCDFQQISYDGQVLAKRDILLDALRRIGKFDTLPSEIRLHPSTPLAYRNRLQLKIVQSQRGASWGFYKASTHEICAIDQCSIASRQIWERLEPLRQAIEACPPILQLVHEVEVFLGDSQALLVDLRLVDALSDLRTLAAAFVAAGRLRELSQLHVVLSSSSGQSVLAAGEGFVWKTVGAFKYRVSHGSFFQVNDLMLSSLRDAALRNYSGESAVELFGGVGFFGLPLAQRFETVQVVEVNSSAISDLRENLALNRVPNIQVFEQQVQSFCTKQRDRDRGTDFLLIDPPRTGLPKESIEAVASLVAKELVYVSCDAATLARDLRTLRDHGYEIGSLDLLDLFPQTHHLETVAHLKRVDAPE